MGSNADLQAICRWYNFFGSHLGDIDVEAANRLLVEFLFRLAAIHIR